MRILRLLVSNFRGIARAELDDLGPLVVIGGANGSGKSHLLDAIRLLKSAYGSYTQNEYQQYFDELQLTTRDSNVRLLRNPAEPLKITCSLQLSGAEKAFCLNNVEDLAALKVWRRSRPGASMSVLRNAHLASPDFEEIRRQAMLEVPNLKEALTKDCQEDALSLSLTIESTGNGAVDHCELAELALSLYRPGSLGVFEYFGPTRYYNRETLANINLQTDKASQEGQHALYNYLGKYANIKSHLAAAYFQQVVGTITGQASPDADVLLSSVRELFETFLDGKVFLGPQLNDGIISFPVQLRDGSTHDIDDLSSGEKELVYGYLRLRSSFFTESVLMFDEPELHLNPKLQRGLASFYDKQLGSSAGNQIWMLTHSDTLLRDALMIPTASIFHMKAPEGRHGGSATTNQAVRLTDDVGLSRMLLELVGDLAAFRPGQAIVIFEGDEAKHFDVSMVSKLFPEFAEAVNAIPGGSKSQVMQLRTVLERSIREGTAAPTVYIVVDRDSDTAAALPPLSFSWDVYHIENYLLDDQAIRAVMDDLDVWSAFETRGLTLKEALKSCAEARKQELTHHQIQTLLYESFKNCLDFKIDPSSQNIEQDTIKRVGDQLRRFGEFAKNFEDGVLKEAVQRFEREHTDALLSEEWRKTFKGRDVLKEFVKRHVSGVDYESFRNLLLSKMKSAGVRPQGMEAVITKILGPLDSSV